MLGCGLAASASVQATTLDDIKFTSLPGNEFEVVLGFSDTPPAPEAYTIDEPARIIIDFPSVQSTLKEKKHALSFENAKSAVVVSSEEKTRLVVNLNKMTGYTTLQEGNTVTLRVVGLAAQPVDRSMASDNNQQNTPAVGASDRSIQDVDFARSEKGEGMVTLTLSNPSVSVDVSQTGTKVIAQFFHTDLPAALDQRLDVIDFATPVKTIDTRREGTTTTVTVEAVDGGYDYIAYQTDNRYVISLKPLSPVELEERQSKFAFVGEKLSLNFQDIEVRSVLQLIADFTELNLVASDTVTGSITVRLENVPWDQALDIVLKAKGLDKRLEGNVLLVAPAAEIAERERLQVEANKQLQELAPLVTEFIRIKYADAVELFELFDVEDDEEGDRSRSRDDDRTATSSILSERGSAIVDKRTNTIILTDTADKIAEFRRLVDKIDIAIRQVEISARIVIATTDFRKELGVRWGAQGASEVGDNVFGFGGGIENFIVPYNPMNRFPRGRAPYVQAVDEDGEPVPPITPTGAIQTAPSGDNIDIFDGLNVDLGVPNPAGKIALQLLTDNAYLDLELSALESAGYAEIASQPKVLTGDKQKAVIRSGKEVAYQEATSSGATSVEFKEAVLKLEVTPQITPDNRIILDLFISQNNVAAEVFGGVPALDITDIETKALVGDGQTLVLGGIFQYEEFDEETKVPLLGDIPYLGRIFKNNFRTSDKREILIFVTPKIVDDQLLDR
ncbi:MAG: fimbrial protein [Gammaproteobacteria bacterium BRH_c0]|nr:MAG: fimbrial protein [Gammaproteobacteria bacterium BRH_c0]